MSTKFTKLLFFALLSFFFSSSYVYGQATLLPWPTITKQLTEAKASTGSALETLIINNQDFSLLREDEKNDKINLPPWLRVWWRKAHPEREYTGEDPTGGYPRVLHEIEEWMESHQNLKSGPGRQAVTQSNAQQDVGTTSLVTNEQRISAAGIIRSESDIRINFFDPTKIIAASNNISGTGKQGIYYSTNSGVSWLQTELPLFSPDAFHSDPTVDWTSDGRAWSSTLGIAGAVVKVRNYYSVNNGASWTYDATASGTQTGVDKQMVWIDHSATSPFFNRQYAIWQVGTANFNYRTAGAGGVWLATPMIISGAETTGSTIGSDIKTNRSGDVFAFWPTGGNKKIIVRKSIDGGVTFGTAVQASTTFDTYDIGVPSFNNRRALIYTSGGAYRTATKNMVYVSWVDLSGETSCTLPANEPGATVASSCKTRVWFVKSADGGATWSAKKMINNPATKNDQFNQWLAVDEVNGTISVMYYDTQDDVNRLKTNVYFQYSSNEGDTWSIPEKVTSGLTDETAASANSGNQYGDYNGLSAYNSVAFPIWTDRRNNANEEAWTAKLTTTVLPVQLLEFTARLQQKNNTIINWSIAAAEDGITYQLQRSANGQSFFPLKNEIGNIVRTTFGYTDAGLPAGIFYYRLKITSVNGEIKYSNVAVIKIGSTDIEVITYPNPIQRTNYKTLQVSITNAALQQYILLDAQGKQLEKKSVNNITGSLSISLPPNLNVGTYILRLQTDKGVYNKKIIVTE